MSTITAASSSRNSVGSDEVEVSGRGRGIRVIDLPAVFTTTEERELLSVITAFDLSRNELTELTNLQPLRSLKRLNASYNHIFRFDGLPLLLTQLNLAHNKLAHLDYVCQLPHLKELDVSFNRLTSLAGLTPRIPLEVLKADDNQIVRTLGLEGVRTLRVLSLRNNYIEDVDELLCLPSMSLLQLLRLAGNPVCRVKRFRTIVGQLQPALVTLDGAALIREDDVRDTSRHSNSNSNNNSGMVHSSGRGVPRGRASEKVTARDEVVNDSGDYRDASYTSAAAAIAKSASARGSTLSAHVSQQPTKFDAQISTSATYPANSSPSAASRLKGDGDYFRSSSAHATSHRTAATQTADVSADDAAAVPRLQAPQPAARVHAGTTPDAKLQRRSAATATTTPEETAAPEGTSPSRPMTASAKESTSSMVSRRNLSTSPSQRVGAATNAQKSPVTRTAAVLTPRHAQPTPTTVTRKAGMRQAEPGQSPGRRIRETPQKRTSSHQLHDQQQQQQQPEPQRGALTRQGKVSLTSRVDPSRPTAGATRAVSQRSSSFTRPSPRAAAQTNNREEDNSEETARARERDAVDVSGEDVGQMDEDGNDLRAYVVPEEEEEADTRDFEGTGEADAAPGSAQRTSTSAARPSASGAVHHNSHTSKSSHNISAMHRIGEGGYAALYATPTHNSYGGTNLNNTNSSHLRQQQHEQEQKKSPQAVQPFGTTNNNNSSNNNRAGSVNWSGSRLGQLNSSRSPASLQRPATAQDFDSTTAQLHDSLVACEQLQKECQALRQKAKQSDAQLAEARRVISQQLAELSQLRLAREALRQSEAELTERLDKERRLAKTRAEHHAEEVATLQGQYARMKTFYEAQLADTRRELSAERGRLTHPPPQQQLQPRPQQQQQQQRAKCRSSGRSFEDGGEKGEGGVYLTSLTSQAPPQENTQRMTSFEKVEEAAVPVSAARESAAAALQPFSATSVLPQEHSAKVELPISHETNSVAPASAGVAQNGLSQTLASSSTVKTHEQNDDETVRQLASWLYNSRNTNHEPAVRNTELSQVSPQRDAPSSEHASIDPTLEFLKRALEGRFDLSATPAVSLLSLGNQQHHQMSREDREAATTAARKLLEDFVASHAGHSLEVHAANESKSPNSQSDQRSTNPSSAREEVEAAKVETSKTEPLKVGSTPSAEAAEYSAFVESKTDERESLLEAEAAAAGVDKERVDFFVEDHEDAQQQGAPGQSGPAFEATTRTAELPRPLPKASQRQQEQQPASQVRLLKPTTPPPTPPNASTTAAAAPGVTEVVVSPRVVVLSRAEEGVTAEAVSDAEAATAAVGSDEAEMESDARTSAAAGKGDGFLLPVLESAQGDGDEVGEEKEEEDDETVMLSAPPDMMTAEHPTFTAAKPLSSVPEGGAATAADFSVHITRDQRVSAAKALLKGMEFMFED